MRTTLQTLVPPVLAIAATLATVLFLHAGIDASILANGGWYR